MFNKPESLPSEYRHRSNDFPIMTSTSPEVPQVSVLKRLIPDKKKERETTTRKSADNSVVYVLYPLGLLAKGELVIAILFHPYHAHLFRECATHRAY